MRRKTAARLIRLWGASWEAWQLPASGSPVLTGAADAAQTGGTANDTLAVPARHVVAAPIRVEADDPEMVRASLELELEVRGLVSRRKTPDAVSSRTMAVDGKTLVVCAVFPSALPEPWGARIFGRYEASPFLVELPEDALALWTEGEDVVAVFTRGRQVVYWATLDRAEGPAAMKRWLEMLMLHLTATGVLAERPRRVVSDSTVPREGLSPFLPGMAEETSSFAPSLKNAKFTWKPELAVEADRKTASIRKVRQAALALAAVYAGLALVGGLYLGWLGWKAHSLRDQIVRLEAATGEFQPVVREWRAVGPSADSRHFPLEILHLVVQNMPPRGIRLTTYDLTDGKISVEGEAASASLASEFYAAISKDRELQEMNWQMPTPSLLPNNAARFQLMGVVP